MMPRSHKVTKKATSKRPADTKVVLSKKSLYIAAIIGLVLFNSIIFLAFLRVQSIQKNSNTIAFLGESKEYSNVKITVSNLKTETDYVMGIKPDNTQKIISINLNIVNNSNKVFDFFPTTQTFIRDDQGSNFIMVPVKLNNTLESANIQPGESKTGQISYMVTNRDIPLYLYIESRQGSGPFVFRLQ